jgi:hypothetical protein
MEKYDAEYFSTDEIEKIMKEERDYRFVHGDTLSPDENLCKYCRNIDKQNKFCWDCDSGSIYKPITRPLFNIFLMYFSLCDGLETAKNNNKSDSTLIIQQGFIEALKFVISPFGSINDIEKKYGEKIITYYNGCPSPEEIMNEDIKYNFKQMKETKDEKEYREKIGTIRPDSIACNFCKYNDRFASKFCWDCSLGSNFKNGIRSVEIIFKMLMLMNTIVGEASIEHGSDEELTLMRLGFAESLKWVIQPYATEEELIEKHGFQYITEDDVNNDIEFENVEYRELDNY